MFIEKKHKDAIDLYLSDMSVAQICKTLGISRTTFYNWMRDPDFKEELQKRKKQIKDEIDVDMTKKSKLYLSKIEEIALNSKSDQVKLKALMYLLDHVINKTEEKEKDKEISWEDFKKKVVNK